MGGGAELLGIPARDLTNADMAALTDKQRGAVQRSDLYHAAQVAVVVYRYVGQGAIPNIPARDLTAADVEALPPPLQEVVAASPLYEQVEASQ